MDTIIIVQKLESLRRCLQRLQDKCPAQSKPLATDPDLQDILVLNLTRAIQLSVDIASHIISLTEEAPPGTMGETFTILEKLAVVDAETASTLRKAVGFRNIAVHNYATVNWDIVHALCTQQLGVFRQFARQVATYYKL